MAYESAVKCWCGKNALEYVSFTEKNPGRRFVKCRSSFRKCAFWEWIDDPLPPLVRSVIDVKVKKAEKKVRVYQVLLIVWSLILLFVVIRVKGDECNCNCSCSRYELA